MDTVERACIFGTPPFIKVDDLRLSLDTPVELKHTKDTQVAAEPAMAEDRTLKTALNNFKKDYLTKILNETGWNQTAAARILDIQRTYVSRLMNELGIRH